MFLLNAFLQKIEELDRELFITINRRWANSLFDEVMPFLRQSVYWAPVYLFVLAFILINFRVKGGWWAVFFLCTVALTDMTGTYIFKHNFERLRPCADAELHTHIRLLLKQCSGGYSFISNHAANHFGMAVFFIITLRRVLGRWVWAALLWAASIAYAQVYVGVHYPADVLAGAIVGTAIGMVTGKTFNKHFRFAIFDK
jgi:undecaprenyl-diphosphatase